MCLELSKFVDSINLLQEKTTHKNENTCYPSWNIYLFKWITRESNKKGINFRFP